MDTTLVDGLTSNASMSIQVIVANSLCVGIGDPGHFSFASSHVGGRHINARSEEALLGEVQRKVSGNLFQFVFGILSRVDDDTGLGTAKGNIDDGALEGH